MPNQTIISVPTNFEDFKQVRNFTARFVEKLDILFGFRSSEGYELAGTAESFATTLSSLIAEVNRVATVAEDSLNSTTEELSLSLDTQQETISTIQQGTFIADLSYSVRTMPAAYSQSTEQDLANDVKLVADKLDSVLAVLRSAGILS